MNPISVDRFDIEEPVPLTPDLLDIIYRAADHMLNHTDIALDFFGGTFIDPAEDIFWFGTFTDPELHIYWSEF